MAVKVFEIGKGNKRKWIDVSDPSKEELEVISRKYGINSYIIRDCLDPDHLPKYEVLQDCTFIITRYFSGNVKQHLDSLQELTNKIAVFYNSNFLITVHRQERPFAEQIIKEANENGLKNNTVNLVTRILYYALQSFEQPALTLGGQVDIYETNVLLKHRAAKPALLQGLYFLKRKASSCKKVLLLTDGVMNFLKTTDANKSAVQDIQDLHTRIQMLYDQVLEDVNNLLNSYLSITTHKTNEIMKVLTIFSVFFMPLTFIVGVYGMNFRHMPELDEKWAYPLVMLFMLAIAMAIFFWIRRKKWL